MAAQTDRQTDRQEEKNNPTPLHFLALSLTFGRKWKADGMKT